MNVRDVYVLLRHLPCSYKRAAQMKAGISTYVAWSAICSLVTRLGYREDDVENTYVPSGMLGGGLVVVLVGTVWGVWNWEEKERVRKEQLKKGKETGEEEDDSGVMEMREWEKIVKAKKMDKEKEKRVMQRKSSTKVEPLTAVSSIVLEKGKQEDKKEMEAAEVVVETIDSEKEGHDKVVCVVK